MEKTHAWNDKNYSAEYRAWLKRSDLGKRKDNKKYHYTDNKNYIPVLSKFFKPTEKKASTTSFFSRLFKRDNLKLHA